MVTIPARTGSRVRRPNSLPALTSANVPKVQGPSDPGVNIPDTDVLGEGLQDFGQKLSDVSNQYAQVAQRQTERKAAVDLAERTTSFQENATAELRRLNAEEDLSDEQVLNKFGEYLNTLREQTIGVHGQIGTQSSIASLNIRLGDVISSLTSDASTISAEIGQRKLADLGDRDIAGLLTIVQQDPGRLDDAIRRFDARADDFAAGLPEGQEMAFRSYGRNAIASGAITRTLRGGDVIGAEKMLLAANNAGLLTSETVGTLTSQITDMRLKQNEANFRLAEVDVAIAEAAERGIKFSDAEVKEMYRRAVSGGSGVTVNVGNGGGGTSALTSGPVKNDLMVRDIDLSLRLLEDMGDTERVILGRIPTTDAYTLRNTIESIQGRLAFDNLMNIKQTTGAGLGALSEGELRALAGLAGSLSTDLSKSVLQANLRDLRNVIKAAETGDEGLIKSAVHSAISKGGNGNAPLPEGIPDGSQRIGTSKAGNPVYKTPDGRRLEVLP